MMAVTGAEASTWKPSDDRPRTIAERPRLRAIPFWLGFGRVSCVVMWDDAELRAVCY